MQWTYLAVLLVSMSGMAVLDWRYKLAWWNNPRATAITLAASVGVFSVWDVLGIVFGVFFSGQSPYMSGVYLAPEFPLEELVFLTFLCYFTLVLYRLEERQWRRTS